MTVQDMIDKLNQVNNKDSEITFVSNQTMDEIIIVDEIECISEYIFYLEFK